VSGTEWLWALAGRGAHHRLGPGVRVGSGLLLVLGVRSMIGARIPDRNTNFFAEFDSYRST
jgi:hypothetical protein